MYCTQVFFLFNKKVNKKKALGSMPTGKFYRYSATIIYLSYNPGVIIFLPKFSNPFFRVHANTLIRERRSSVTPSEKVAIAGVINGATATWL